MVTVSSTPTSASSTAAGGTADEATGSGGTAGGPTGSGGTADEATGSGGTAAGASATSAGGASTTESATATTTEGTTTATSNTATTSTAAASTEGTGTTVTTSSTSGGNDNSWAAECEGVTMNGRCNGNVYEWCDYFTQGLKQIDCEPLGMTCVATISQPWEWESNGCVRDGCTNDEDGCDGSLMFDCDAGELVVWDCEKLRGPGSVCVLEGDSTPECTLLPCDEPSLITCAGTVQDICMEDGKRYIVDCARCDPADTCNPAGVPPNCSGGTYECGFQP